MAQEQNRPQPQQQQSRPTPSVISPASPFYSKDNLPTGEVAQPARWLFDRSWKCIGDPSWPSAQWFDPLKPFTVESREELKFGYVERINRAKKDSSGKPTLELVWEQLYDQDGSDRGNRTVPITQTTITHPASAMTMQEAILCQLERERRAVEEAQKQQKKSVA